MFSDYASLIVLLPVLTFVLTLALGKRLPHGGAYLPILAIALSFVISLGTLLEIYPGGVVSVSWPWFGEFNLGIIIDPLAAVMLVMVSFVSLLIHIYAIGYMAHDPSKSRYFAETSLFTAAMLAVALSDNILQFFIAWEIVGMCSYLLIGFWYHKPSAAAAAKKAFLVTRVGDVLFLAGIIVLYLNMADLTLPEGSYILQFKTMFASIPQIPPSQLTLITLLFFGGAVGKSGQFPLHVWLPDAMEGPTTVSALIHAATMVTAGVYLVARTFPMFLAAPSSLVVVAYIGAFTALFAATMGLVMNDIKRVLAYSTVSQLGYMMLALGTGAVIGAEAVGVSLFHLISHAFFKALLFLCAGSVIHAVGTNDLREMGGLLSRMKITGWTMFAGALSLAGIGIPFLNIGVSGFFSKDPIIEGAYEYGAASGDMIPWTFSVVAALLTSIYIFRLWFMAFTGKPRQERHAHESPPVMTGPLVILAILAIVFGGVSVTGFTHYVGENFEVLKERLEISSLNMEELAALGGHELAHNEEGVPVPVAVLPVAVGFLGLLISYIVYYKRSIRASSIVSSRNPVYKLLLNRYYQHQIYTEGVGQTLVFGLARIGEFVDRKVIDALIIDRVISSTLIFLGEVLRKLQTGVVQTYAAITILGVVILLLITGGI